MRKILALLSASVALFPAAAAHASIHWGHSLPAAFRQSKARHKLVMVDFYTGWCYWCKQLDAKVYPLPSVERTLQQVIPVKLNAEKDGIAYAKKYNVTGYPDVLFLNSRGTVVGQIGGFEPAPAFIADVNRFSKNYQQLQQMPALRAELAKQPSNAGLISRMAMLYAKTNQLSAASALLARLEKTDPHNKTGMQAPLLQKIADAHQSAGQYSEAIALFQKSLAVANTPYEKAYAHISIASCYLQQNQPDKAVPQLKATAAVPNCPPDILQNAQLALKQISH